MSSLNPFKSLFKKIRIINTIKKQNEEKMTVTYIQSEVYCFKVKSLYKDDFLRLSETCLKDFGVRVSYNTQFNIIQFYEINFSIDNFVYNDSCAGDLNSKNFCNKIKNLSEEDIDKFPRNVKECREYLKSKLEILEEGVYRMNYLSF